MPLAVWASPGWVCPWDWPLQPGEPLLRWSAPRQRNVLYVDGEMPLVSLQERLKEISAGFGRDIPNDGFQILAADNVEGGINLSTEEGQQAIEPLLADIDLLDPRQPIHVADQVEVKRPVMPGFRCRIGCSSCVGRESRSCSFIMPERMDGRRGTSRREDALDTVIALRRPEDYSPEQGARFEIHFEKLRNRVDAAGAMPFEARLETLDADGQQRIRWSSSDLKPPMLMRAAELFGEG